MLIVLCTIVAWGLMGCGVQAQEFSGTYTVSTPDGLLQLTLRQAEAEAFSGTLLLPSGVAFQAQGAVAVDDEDGPVSLEGTLAGPNERGAFTLESADEHGDYYLAIIPHDASGTPRLDQLAGYLVQRDESAESSDHHLSDEVDSVADCAPLREDVDPQADGASRDLRLAGRWATQVVMNSAGGSIATQLLMEIRPDGILIDRGSRAVGSFADAGLETGYDGGGETVAWRTQQNVLFVSRQGIPWVPLAQFEISGDRLLLSYYDGDRAVWYRQ